MTTSRGCRHLVVLAPFFAALAGGIVPGTLLASDPLAMIPADVSLVFAFPNLERASARLNAFVRTVDPDHAGVDVDEVQRGFNLADGVLDTTAPAYLVLTRPSFVASSFVLVFTPRDREAFDQEVANRDDAPRRCSGPEGSYCLMMRDGVAFVARKRRPIRRFRRLPREESLAAALHEEQRKLLTGADAVAHVPLAQWRERIKPYAFVATNLIEASLAAQQDRGSASRTAEAMDWLISGLRSVIDQMEAVTLALDFDGETFRLTHLHTFAGGQSVAKYLGEVQHTGRDRWTSLPDRPFLLLGASDWRVGPETSLMVGFYKHLFSADTGDWDIPPETRRRILSAARSSYPQVRGSDFMVTAPAGKLLPLQVFGQYDMDDAESGLRDFMYLAENVREVVSPFMSGSRSSKFVERRRAGIEFYEMPMDLEGLRVPAQRQAATILYGEDVRVQNCVAGKHRMVFSLARPPAGVLDLLKTRRPAGTVRKNPRVRRIVGRLPDRPSLVIVADVGRCFAIPRSLVEAGLTKTPPHELTGGAISADYVRPPGPLVGWACVLGRGWFKGQVCMDADDIVRSLALWHGGAENTSTPVAKGTDIRHGGPPTDGDRRRQN